MKVFASSFHAWRMLEENEDIAVPHGLIFPLAILEAIGRPYGLEMTAEEHEPNGPMGYDAIFLSVLDSRCMIEGGKNFESWRVPLRRVDREGGNYPLIWAGGQGLHNPLPMADIFDLCVIGDAEESLPKLLTLWDQYGGDRRRFLREAAEVRSVYVPSLYEQGMLIQQAVADDISVTLREEIMVSLNGQRRVEIARGCRYKCGFCSLGWRAPVRENSTSDVINTIKISPRIVHLQAGDAESHSGITEIREALIEHGGRDNGWTGRLDTTMDNPDTEIPGTKRYAFGVEGISHRLRCAVGKDYLTPDRLARDTVSFLSRIEGTFYGRAAWHLISGLPTERPEEIEELRQVIKQIDAGMRGSQRRNLALHWQPFCPLPGTPMQWFGAGHSAWARADSLRDLESLPRLVVKNQRGRTDYMAALCTILSRATASGGANLIEAYAAGRVSLQDARQMAEAHEGDLDPDAPLPWDFINHAYDRQTLRRAYDVTCRKLAGLPVGEWRDMRSDPDVIFRSPETRTTNAIATTTLIQGDALATAAEQAREFLRRKRQR